MRNAEQLSSQAEALPWQGDADRLLAPLAPRILRLDLVAENPIPFGANPGSAFRSVFGLALKRVSCPDPAHICSVCRHDPSCLYSFAFETPARMVVAGGRKATHWPHPLVMRIDTHGRDIVPPGSQFSLELILLGVAQGGLDGFLDAVAEAGALGIGRSRGRFRVQEARLLDHLGRRIPVEATGASHRSCYIDPCRPFIPSAAGSATTLSLHLLTPLRLLEGKRPVRRLAFPILIRAILRRYVDLIQAYGNESITWRFDEILRAADEVVLVESATSFQEARRYSSRQRADIPIGGLTGVATFEGRLGAFCGLLRTAELLHIGKGTILGHGRVVCHLS